MRTTFDFPANAVVQKRRDRVTMFLFVLCMAFVLWFMFMEWSAGKSHSPGLLIALSALVVFVLLAWIIRKRFALVSSVHILENELEIVRAKDHLQTIPLNEIVSLMVYASGKHTYYALQYSSSNDLIILEHAEKFFVFLSERLELPIKNVAD